MPLKLLLALLVAAGAAAALQKPASAQSGASTFTGWECVIDVRDALGEGYVSTLPAEIRTTNTSKLCTGDPSDNIFITCKARIPGWTLGARNFSDVACQLFLGQCGGQGFVLGNNNRLQVAANGDAELDCRRVGGGEG